MSTTVSLKKLVVPTNNSLTWASGESWANFYARAGIASLTVPTFVYLENNSYTMTVGSWTNLDKIFFWGQDDNPATIDIAEGFITDKMPQLYRYTVLNNLATATKIMAMYGTAQMWYIGFECEYGGNNMAGAIDVDGGGTLEIHVDEHGRLGGTSYIDIVGSHNGILTIYAHGTSEVDPSGLYGGSFATLNFYYDSTAVWGPAVNWMGTTHYTALAKAANVFYDNNTSHLSASNVNDAVDELQASKQDSLIFSGSLNDVSGTVTLYNDNATPGVSKYYGTDYLGVKGYFSIPSPLATGNLTETTSNVLTVTGGTGAVIGTGTTIQVKQSSGAQSGFLSDTDWSTFNSKQAGATNLTSLSGLTYASASFVKMTGTNTFTLDTNTYQASATNLTSLAGLTYASASFVKMTGANTFTLDTNTYISSITTSTSTNGSGFLKGNGSVISFDNSTYQPSAANLTSVAGLTYASTSFVKMSGTNTFSLDTSSYQAASTNLTSLGGLTYASTSFVKMTAAATFALDTTTYISQINTATPTNGTGFLKGNGSIISFDNSTYQPSATNLTSLAGLTYVSGSFVKMNGAGTFNLDTNSYQVASASLSSLAGLTYASASFVKMTAANTFALDTGTYQSILWQRVGSTLSPINSGDNVSANGYIGPYLRASADGINAIQVQNATSGVILNIDTTNTRFGFGTTTPVNYVDMTQAAGGTLLSLYSQNINTQTSVSLKGFNSGQGRLVLNHTRNTYAAPGATLSGTILGYLIYGGSTAASLASSGTTYIIATSTENFSGAAQGTKLQFFNCANTTNTAVERMTIDQNGNVGVGGATTPTSSLHTGGSFARNYTALSGNTTLDATHSIVATTGSITITLPTAVGITGRQYDIKKTDSGTTLTINTTSSQTIDGSITLTITSQYTNVTVVSTGSNWYII